MPSEPFLDFRSEKRGRRVYSIDQHDERHVGEIEKDVRTPAARINPEGFRFRVDGPLGCRLGPVGFECVQHRETPRPSVEKIRRKSLLGF